MPVARKFVLPRLTVTERVDQTDPHAQLVAHSLQPYFVRPLLVPGEHIRRDGKPSWAKHQFNLFPMILDHQGVPWAEANVYLLARLEGHSRPNMASYSSIADDLTAYRQFLDEHEIDWTVFGPQKLTRPTYRFNGHLKFAIRAGEIAATTAHRRIGSVIGYYRWLITEGVLKVDHPPWKETDRYVQFKDGQGFARVKKVIATDISLNVPRQQDPYDGTIDDGGKLRPLPLEEQEWLVDALRAVGNTEMTLIHLTSLLSGARLQTVLTMRVRHALIEAKGSASNEIRLPVGPGTGIDTKFNKRGVMHLPTWFCEMLRTYAHSDRAKARRALGHGAGTDDPFLFVSNRGTPFYDDWLASHSYDESNSLRHRKSGQAIRQFIRDQIIPLVRTVGGESFYYRFHDLRATAGMNWTDAQLAAVERGECTLHEAREFVRVRMGHSSSAVTDRYIQYRHSLKMVRRTEESHEKHLRDLAIAAITLAT